MQLVIHTHAPTLRFARDKVEDWEHGLRTPSVEAHTMRNLRVRSHRGITARTAQSLPGEPYGQNPTRLPMRGPLVWKRKCLALNAEIFHILISSDMWFGLLVYKYNIQPSHKVGLTPYTSYIMSVLRGGSSCGNPVPGFPGSPACVWQQRGVKAVGNRNTMAASLSLTQVTLSYNSTITTASASWLLSGVPWYLSVMLVKPAWRKCERTSLLVLLFLEFSPAVTGKSFCPVSLGTA